MLLPPGRNEGVWNKERANGWRLSRRSRAWSGRIRGFVGISDVPVPWAREENGEHLTRTITMTTKTRSRPARHVYSPEEWDETLKQFDEWSLRATVEKGSFEIREAQKALGLRSTAIAKIFAAFQCDGRLHSLGHKMGFARTGAVTPGATLKDLMDLAAPKVNRARKARRGRPSIEESRRLDELSEGQWKDINTMARLVAEAVTGDPLNWRAVGPEYFSWDESAGDGAAGEWKLIREVERWATERARRTAAATGSSWDRTQSESMVKKYCGAAARLLDLAVTHGRLSPTLRHSRAYEVYAAEWVPFIESWSRRLGRRQRAAEGTFIKLRRGCRTLALYATRAGSLAPEKVDWPAIRDAIQRDFERGAIKYDTMTWARFVYRAIRAIRRIPGSEWEMAQPRRTTLVPKAAIRLAARSGRPDFSGWVLSDGRPATALVEGHYGLRPWVSWATLPTSRQLERAGLPRREWPDPTAEERRRLRRRPDLFKLSTPVVENRLNGFALLAGWAAEHRGIDWAMTDATALVTPDLAHDFATWLAQRRGDPEGGSALASQTLFALATFASPFLEARAHQSGDLERARLLRKQSDELKELAIAVQAEGQKRIQYIASLWDAGTGRGGWSRLLELRDLLIEEIEEAGGSAVADQITAIRSGHFHPRSPVTWAIAVRAAVLITLVRRIPLRVRAISSMTRVHWRSSAPSMDRSGDWTEPWEGAIRTEFPSALMKGGRPFAPYLIRPEKLGDPHQERLLRRDVLELYFMAEGARDEILRVDGVPVPSEYVFPALARRGGREADQDARVENGLRWDEGSLSEHFSTLVLRYAERLGMDVDALKAEWGATSIHVIRLLYGTSWAPRRLLETSRMLHHANVGITERRYCGVDASMIDLEIDAESLPSQKGLRELSEENRRLREIIAQLSSQLSRAA